jgi:hypothetical protein
MLKMNYSNFQKKTHSTLPSSKKLKILFLVIRLLALIFLLFFLLTSKKMDQNIKNSTFGAGFPPHYCCGSPSINRWQTFSSALKSGMDKLDFIISMRKGIGFKMPLS